MIDGCTCGTCFCFYSYIFFVVFVASFRLFIGLFAAKLYHRSNAYFHSIRIHSSFRFHSVLVNNIPPTGFACFRDTKFLIEVY